MSTQSRTIINDIRNILGDAFLSVLYGCNKRTLQRWTALEGCVTEDSIRENHIEKLEKIVERLQQEQDRGGDLVAQALVSHLAARVGGRLEMSEVNPDKPTIEEELLDDADALSLFREKVRNGAPESEIRAAARAIKKEVDETLHLATSLTG